MQTIEIRSEVQSKELKSDAQIVEVRSGADKRDFLDISRTIYKDDPHWVCQLDIELEHIFDESINPFFDHGKANRWILKSNGSVIGRIAAFINEEKKETFDPPTGGVGFFECTDDASAGFHLFNTAKNWLKNLGMKAMEGPINFGENNNHWGLLVDGFTHPAFGMNYNKSYYKDIFESYGFEPQYEQYTNHFDASRPLPERFRKIAGRVFNNPNYTFESLDMSQSEKYVNDMAEVYNKSWTFHKHFNELEPDYIKAQFQDMKSFIVPKMIWFAYVNGSPAAFMISIPDINQVLKHLHGKMGTWEKLKFFWLLKILKVVNRVRVIIMGVAPEYQNRGIESGLIVKSFDAVSSMKRYKEGELSWVGSFNESMIAIHKASGATFGKKHITYLKLF